MNLSIKICHPGLFNCLFSVFYNKHYNFYKICENIYPVADAGIRTHDL